MTVGVELDLVGCRVASGAFEGLCSESKETVVFDKVKELKADVESPETGAPEPECVLDSSRDGEDTVAAQVSNCLHGTVGQHRPTLNSFNVVQQSGRGRRAFETDHPLEDGQDTPDTVQHPGVTDECAELLNSLRRGGGLGGTDAEHTQPQCILKIEQHNDQLGRVLSQHEALVRTRPCGEVADHVVETRRRLDVGEAAEDLVCGVGGARGSRHGRSCWCWFRHCDGLVMCCQVDDDGVFVDV